jgi:hypothetical protein
MRNESEIREMHGYLRAAWDSATRDGSTEEADKIALAMDALVWVLEGGERFAAIIEAARKCQDDIELGVEVLN